MNSSTDTFSAPHRSAPHTTTPAPLLETRGLDQSYGESRTLWDVDLEVPSGSCISLIGRNGVGKTTLLGCLMGLVRAHAGTITFDGADLTRALPEKRAALGIGYVPQGRMIFPLLTVEENLRTGLAVRRSATKALPELVFELFPVLRTMLKRRGGDLSGGQQQQLAIARALVLEPRLLMLDEPTEGIQPSIVAEIGDVIRRLNQELGLTVLVVEQKLPFVRRFCDSFRIMDKGRIVASGDMDELTDGLVKTYLTV